LPALFSRFSVEAQQPTTVARIGYKYGGFASTNAARSDGFRQGLRDLGFIEGKNIVIEKREDCSRQATSTA